MSQVFWSINLCIAIISLFMGILMTNKERKKRATVRIINLLSKDVNTNTWSSSSQSTESQFIELQLHRLSYLMYILSIGVMFGQTLKFIPFLCMFC